MMPLNLLQHAEGAAAPGMPGPFHINLGLGVFTTIVFLAMFGILAKFIFPTLVKMTADREANLKKLQEEAATMHAEAKKSLEEQRTLLAAARTDAQGVMNEARQAAERERMLGMEKTRVEQEELLARARHEITVERDRAKAELRRETVDLAIAAAGKVVGQRFEATQDRKLVEDYLASIGSST